MSGLNWRFGILSCRNCTAAFPKLHRASGLVSSVFLLIVQQINTNYLQHRIPEWILFYTYNIFLVLKHYLHQLALASILLETSKSPSCLLNKGKNRIHVYFTGNGKNRLPVYFMSNVLPNRGATQCRECYLSVRRGGKKCTLSGYVRKITVKSGFEEVKIAVIGKNILPHKAAVLGKKASEWNFLLNKWNTSRGGKMSPVIIHSRDTIYTEAWS